MEEKKVVPWKDPRMYVTLVGLFVTWIGYWWAPIKSMLSPEMTNTIVIAIMGAVSMAENRKPVLKP